MATPDFTGGNVMDTAAALNNDAAATIYNYQALTPYLRLALQELQELFELNEIALTAVKSTSISVPAGNTTIAFNAAPAPELPDDLIEPQQLWEGISGSDYFVPMTRLNQIPLYFEGQPTNLLMYWAWNDQQIKFPASTNNNVVKIQYIKAITIADADESTNIGVVNGKSFLEYRTGALAALYIGENPTRSEALNNDAGLSMDRVLGIGAKGRQSIVTRRRPFRASYKMRGIG